MTDLKKYLMFVSYVGSAFRGSQLQIPKPCGPVIVTVQEIIENTFKNILKLEGNRPVCVRFASRTDKGVHALRAALVVDLPLGNYFKEPEHLKYCLNDHFIKKDRKDIRISDVYAVPDSFKFNELPVEKTYLYRVGILKKEFADSYKKDVPFFEVDKTYFLAYKELFDLERAEKAAKLFEGKKDFGAVIGRPSKNYRSTVCNIKSFSVEEAQSFVPFDSLSESFNFYHLICTGDRFGYCMVRRLVSLVLSVGFNKLSFEDIQKLINEPVPSSWPRKGVSVVPGCGLYLVNTKFNMEKFIQKEHYFFENSAGKDELKDIKNINSTVSLVH